MAHAQITVEPFGGSEKEDFHQFEQLFRNYVAVAAVGPAQQANFLQLHLRDKALRFHQNLPEATRIDLNLSLDALRNHFCNLQVQEVLVLKLAQEKFDPKKDTPENFLVNLQRKAIRAYPTPNLPAVAPLDPGAPDAAIEGARFARETAHRQERIDAVTDHRNEQVKRLFIKAMPGWLRSKLMDQPTATPIDDLCNLSRRQITIRELCRKDDYPEDGFNEINESVSENLINALSKITTAQQALEKRFTDLDRRLE